MIISHAPAKVAILSPTRNEALNIEAFTRRVTEVMEQTNFEWEIVFADDSDDNTPEIVEKLQHEGHAVRCVHRSASLRRDSISGAIRAALATVDDGLAIVIDADLQHPPSMIPALLIPIANGEADFAIGSRYLAGGSATGLSSGWRRFASRFAALVTTAMFPEWRSCSDLSSGLFAFRVEDFGSASVPSTGFKVLPEALVRCNPTTVAEASYRFEERYDGLSKARIRDGFRLFKSLAVLRLSTRRWHKVRVVLANPTTNAPTAQPD